MSSDAEKVDGLEAQAMTREEITNEQCNYSCRLDDKKFLKPNKTEKFVRLAEHQQQIQKQKDDFIDHISKLNGKFRVLEGRLKECEKEFARQLERLSDLKAKDSKERLNQARQLIEKNLYSWNSFELLQQVLRVLEEQKAEATA